MKWLWITGSQDPASPSLHPLSRSGMLLPRLRTRANSSISFALLRRWLAAACHASRTCTPPGSWGVHWRLWMIPPTLDTNCLRHSLAVHQDQNLTPQEQFLPNCSWPHQQGPSTDTDSIIATPHYINIHTWLAHLLDFIFAHCKYSLNLITVYFCTFICKHFAHSCTKLYSSFI